jgi:valyl-tRNA synthetase
MELSLPDRWIRSRLSAALARIHAGFSDYRLDAVVAALYEFTWNEYCDWYLEFSKAVLQSEDATPARKRGTLATLVGTLETLLRALHPVAPYISEEIWQRVRTHAGSAGDSIMRAPYPEAAAGLEDAAADREMGWVREFILGLRQIRGEMDIAPSRKLDVLLQNAGPEDLRYLDANLGFLTRLAGMQTCRVLPAGETAPIAAVALLGQLEILVPMQGLIDPTAELERLDKRRRKAEADLGRLAAKLDNPDFAKNAPPEVVAKDEQRRTELSAEIGQLQAQIARVRRLLGQ